jgi:hypothetical protein
VLALIFDLPAYPSIRPPVASGPSKGDLQVARLDGWPEKKRFIFDMIENRLVLGKPKYWYKEQCWLTAAAAAGGGGWLLAGGGGLSS